MYTFQIKSEPLIIIKYLCEHYAKLDLRFVYFNVYIASSSI